MSQWSNWWHSSTQTSSLTHTCISLRSIKFGSCKYCMNKLVALYRSFKKRVKFARLSTILWKVATGRLLSICIGARTCGMMHTGSVSPVQVTKPLLTLLQVAKTHGGSNAANQVAYLWAKSLGEVNVGIWMMTTVCVRRRKCSEATHQVWAPWGCSWLCYWKLVRLPLLWTISLLMLLLIVFIP